MCDYEPSTKNNNRYIKLHNNIVPISQIYSIFTIDSDVYFESEEETFQFALPDIEIDSDIVTTFVNDIMNNMHDDFALSSVHDILCRKLFIYLTINITEEYANRMSINLISYINSDLESLISDCSSIICHKDIYECEEIQDLTCYEISKFEYLDKHIEPARIWTCSKDTKFASMYKDWILLKNIVNNFEIYY